MGPFTSVSKNCAVRFNWYVKGLIKVPDIFKEQDTEKELELTKRISQGKMEKKSQTGKLHDLVVLATSY
jgi:hypothetical protein